MRAAAAALALALIAAPAPAADWGGIEPGVTTVEQVRGRWGAPSKESRAKVEGYDTTQWVYEGERAPDGIRQMTVDFGLLAAGGYRPNVVRLLTLEPRPAIFGRSTILQGWGIPDGVKGKELEDLTFFYREGLLVFFDKGDFAHRMVFSVPQPVDPAPAGSPGSPGPPGTGRPPATAPPPAAPPPAVAPAPRR